MYYFYFSLSHCLPNLISPALFTELSQNYPYQALDFILLLLLLNFTINIFQSRIVMRLDVSGTRIRKFSQILRLLVKIKIIKKLFLSKLNKSIDNMNLCPFNQLKINQKERSQIFIIIFLIQSMKHQNMQFSLQSAQTASEKKQGKESSRQKIRKEKKIKKLFKSRVLHRQSQILEAKLPGDTVVAENQEIQSFNQLY